MSFIDMKVELTGKVWNNELAGKTNFRKGHSWNKIMDSVKEGDKVINGIGEVFICTNKYDLNEYHDFGHKALRVTLHPTKKDGTIHKGRRWIAFVDSGTGWEIEE
tara:strand:- start:302 stop:616 length:315 start_codon:yes stop_codon:yes gene_type:complete